MTSPAALRPTKPAEFALSALQRGMLFHYALDGGGSANVNQSIFTLPHDIDVAALHRACRHVAARHDALRTAFRFDVVPVQVVAAHVDVPLVVKNHPRGDAAAREAALAAFLADDRARAFALEQAPLFRLTLLRHDAGCEFVFTYHHAIADGTAVHILLREVQAAYEAFLRGAEPALPEAPQFAEHIAWLEQQDFSRDAAFWRDRFAGTAAPTPLPHGEPQPAGPAEESRMRRRRLPPDVSAALHATARAAGVTVTTLAQAAWALFLARHAGTDDVVFGVTRACRRGGSPRAAGIVGLLVNTLPFRVRVADAQPVAAWLSDIRAAWDALREREHTPLPLVQQWSEIAPPAPMFRSIAVTHAGRVDEVLAAETGVPFWSNLRWAEQTQYPLALHVADAAAIGFALSFDPAHYDSATVERFVDEIEAAFAGIAAHASGTVGDIDLLRGPWREHVLAASGTPVPAFRNATVHALFAERARAHPAATALQSGDDVLSYGALDVWSAAVAHTLRRAGVGRGDRVALYGSRSFETIAAMLGILRCGAAYVPLDPAYPGARLAAMLADAAPAAVVAESCRVASIAVLAGSVPVITVARPPAHSRNCGPEPAAVGGADDPAYVMYTSGSTGVPKGVAIAHRGIVRLVTPAHGLAFGPQHAVLALAPLAFDASTFEIYAALLHGARLVLAAPEQQSLAAIAEAIERHAIGTVFLTTAVFEQLERTHLARMQRLEQLIFGGDVPAPEHVRRIAEALPHCRVYNAYGPTENTTFTTLHRITLPVPATAVPIGRPIAGTSAYVMDERGRLVPFGVTGELYAGGDGVGLGYIGRPEETRERFVRAPFDTLPGTLYRTGDRVRQRPDGTLEFCGRVDDQVKIRGYRVEPGEVAAALRALPGVRDAVIVVRGSGAGRKRLVAYVTAHGGTPDAGALQAALERVLPAHLLPSAIVPLAELPLTPAGKIDRAALPAPAPPARPRQRAQQPQSVEECMLARIWRQVLGADVGIDADFFASGGDSLGAMRVIARVRDSFAVELPVRALFENPTIASLARAIAGHEPNSDSRARDPNEIVAVRAEGTKPPFVLVHGDLRSGGYYCYALARHLDPEQPFFVFEPHGIEGAPLPSVAAMAAGYVDVLRRRFGRSAYRLGGYCGGGLVALEMARQLAAAGEPVDHVLLVETDVRAAVLVPFVAAVERLPDPAGRLAAARLAPALALAAHAVSGIELRTAARLRGAVVRRLRTLRRRRAPAGPAPPPDASDALVARWSALLARHVPRRYGGAVTALYAQAHDVDTRRLTAAWRRVAPQARVARIPGDHFTCITRHVAGTASAMQRALDD